MFSIKKWFKKFLNRHNYYVPKTRGGIYYQGIPMYVPPLKTMSGKQALKELKQGKKITCNEWKPNEYWQSDMGGNIYDENGNLIQGITVACHFADERILWQITQQGVR